MLEWLTPQIEDGRWIMDIVRKSECMGSDTSFANIYLLRNKYDIQVCHYRDFLIRHYNGFNGRKGYTFPLGSGDIEKALRHIEEDAVSRGEELSFCLLTEGQKQLLEKMMPDRLEFTTDQGDSDYIYSRQSLAALSGRAYHKKKNHFSKFTRTYPDYRFEELGCVNLDDARTVEDAWYYEHLQTEDESQLKEYEAIKEALDNFDELELKGGIIYVNDTPVAMTIASVVSEQVCDIHFEKAIGESVVNGAYAAINRCFAQTLDYQWINREEDIGIEGLRKAKMSYHPEIILKKYNARAIVR